MPILKFSEFSKLIQTQTQSCLIGLDVGTKIVGASITDSSYKIAAPLATLKRYYENETLFSKQLIPLYKQNKACGLVVGWPISETNKITKQCQDILTCVNHLWMFSQMDIPVYLMDERYTTNMAYEIYNETTTKKTKKIKYKDKLSAILILQSFCDKYNHIDNYGDLFNHIQNS
ncbi:hypothetical protein WA158_006017 [Blastocystis sp. Blastoise]